MKITTKREISGWEVVSICEVEFTQEEYEVLKGAVMYWNLGEQEIVIEPVIKFELDVCSISSYSRIDEFETKKIAQLISNLRELYKICKHAKNYLRITQVDLEE